MSTAEKPIQELIREHRASLPTPYYLIDEPRLLENLKKIRYVRERSGAKSVLALKCFSTWAVFDLMRQYMDGTTSSSLYEARLGYEKFGKEVHAYCVAFSDEDVRAVRPFASKVIFNSVSQLKRYAPSLKGLPLGLRVNPGVSHSDFDLADPARRYSRLGATARAEIEEAAPLISGAMFHCNCENDDFKKFGEILDHIGRGHEPLLRRLEWVSFGGGIYFTKEGYPLDAFCDRLSEFSRRFGVQVYLEPGETAVTRSGFFVTKVLDIVRNEIDIAIVDGAVEPHMLDLLIYRTDAKIEIPQRGGHTYMVAGRTCLAGDVFGTYTFPEKLEVGSLVPFADAAGYSMVKKNWFNGVQMPAIVVRRLDGRVEKVKEFTYEDYLLNLS
ncbi:MAG TPA: carboxynorspermidine decarboxylase [Elusimicrobiota bacterium]|nr:carboxynorspermidine decarboxylase [Elusimicrobiota bacterium]